MVSSVVIDQVLSMKADVGIKEEGLVYTLKFETKMPPFELARLLNMYSQDKHHLALSVTSTQLDFDLSVAKEPASVS